MKHTIKRFFFALILVVIACLLPTMSASAAPAGDRLDGLSKTIYDDLKPQIVAVASGQRTSTEFVVSADLSSLKWTKEELGVSVLTSGNSVIQEAKVAVASKLSQVVDFDRLIDALNVDCMADLFWYDKVTGTQYNYAMSTDGNSIRLTTLTFYFAVSVDYSAGEYLVDGNKVAKSAAVMENAAVIVAKYASKTDIEKLVAYKNEICALAEYNHAAADNGATPYGLPWQMISVFDKDPGTNPVCEGYAKAFQYLCDLSTFSGDVSCYLISGYMQGGTGAGNHMWNVVQIGGGTFLVDVTNCDDGTIGAPDLLFLKGGAKNGNTYSVDAGNTTIYYVYDEDQYNLYTDGYLELSDPTQQPTGGSTCAHSYETTTTKATLSKNGSVVKECTVCGKVDSTKTIKYVKTIKLSKTSFVYNGKVQKPTITVKDSAGKTLKEGTDYTVTYASGCKKAGTYKVTVKFKGNYSGTKTMTFKILPVAKVATQPKTQKVEAGEKIKFTVKATGTGLKYQWQYSTNGKTWKNCSSSAAQKASFSFTSKTSHDGNYYRCKVTDSAGNVVYTKAVRAYVLGVSVQPKTNKVKVGEKIKFTVKATGTGLKYQWQYSTNGKTWKNCSASAAKKASFSFKAKTSHDGNYYRCKVTDSAGNVVYTKAVRAYVLGIEKQPVKKTVTKNKTAKFTVDASGNGLKYQWQYSTNGGKTWKTCSGSAAKKAAYSFKAKISQNGYYFRCKITDSAKNVIYTSEVKLTVKK